MFSVHQHRGLRLLLLDIDWFIDGHESAVSLLWIGWAVISTLYYYQYHHPPVPHLSNRGKDWEQCFGLDLLQLVQKSERSKNSVFTLQTNRASIGCGLKPALLDGLNFGLNLVRSNFHTCVAPKLQTRQSSYLNVPRLNFHYFGPNFQTRQTFALSYIFSQELTEPVINSQTSLITLSSL